MFGLVELVLLIIVGLGVAFWIWMLVECATKEADSGNTKIIWIIIIVFAGCIGPAIYFFARRPRRQVELGR